MSGFYKMDPAKWDFGTAELSLEEEAAYLRIINAIHKHDDGVPDNDRVLSGLFRTSTRKARALVNSLIAAGKLVMDDGKIWNDKARNDIIHRAFVTISRVENGAKGGRTRALNASKPLKDKKAGQAIASSRIEENREEEKREANASPKKATRLPSEWRLPMDWGEWSMAHGMTEPQVRGEADRFRDYWISKSGRDGTKLDWQATWRNWCRTFIDRNPRKLITIQGGTNGKPDPTTRMDAFIAGSRGSPGMDRRPHPDPSQPLLARG